MSVRIVLLRLVTTVTLWCLFFPAAVSRCGEVCPPLPWLALYSCCRLTRPVH
jgi:hypothetical protein